MSDFREAMWGVVQTARLRARLRLRRLRGRALRAHARDRGRPALRALARGGAWRRGLSCRTRARCVIIGGGVGGTLDRLPPRRARLGATSSCSSAPSSPSGSTFHSAGLVGQLRGSVSLTKMMMHSVELYRRLGDGVRVRPGLGRVRRHPAGLAASERMEELRRQAGWAKTFGLPLELISAEEAQRDVPADVDRRACSARPGCRPTATSTPPSSPTRSPTAPAAGGCRIFTNTRVTGIDVERRPRARRARPSAATIEAEVVVNAGGMYAAEIGRMAGVRVPVIPMSHQYLVTQPFRERGERAPADAARPRPARLLPRGGRRPGDGRLRARSAPCVPARRAGGLDAHPARLQRPPARGRLGPLRGDRRELASAACRRWTTSRSRS